MNILIREYAESDWSKLVEMTIAIVDMMSSMDPHKRFRPKEKLDAEVFARCELERVRKTQGNLLLAEVDGEIVGYIMGTINASLERDNLNKFPSKQGCIDALYVDDTYRGKGVSAQLMKAMEDYFKKMECVHVGVSCIAANGAARSFYLKQGYGEQYIDFLKKL